MYGDTGAKGANKVKRAMHERKAGTLRSGSSGKKITCRNQAIAIGLSETRSEGGKVPGKQSAHKKSSLAPAGRAPRLATRSDARGC